MPACSSGTSMNVLPQRNAMPQTHEMTPHPVTLYKHWANMSLCFPLMWNVKLEYLATYSAFQTFRQSAFRKRNENTEYLTYIQYDFQKDKPKTISEIYSKDVKIILIIKFDAFESSLMHICSTHNFAHCVFQ